MAIKTFTAGSVLTASDTNTYLANAGLVFVKSQTVGTAVSSQNVTSCFSSTYDDYVIHFDGITSGAAGVAMVFKYLSGTTASSTSYYYNTFYIATGAAGGLTNSAGSNVAYAECLSMSNTYQNTGKLEVFAPYLATASRHNWINADNSYFRFGAGIHQAATSYDGIQFTPLGTTMTGGTITVYGVRKG